MPKLTSGENNIFYLQIWRRMNTVTHSKSQLAVYRKYKKPPTMVSSNVTVSFNWTFYILDLCSRDVVNIKIVNI